MVFYHGHMHGRHRTKEQQGGPGVVSAVSRKTDESFPIDFTVLGFQEEPMLDAMG